MKGKNNNMKIRLILIALIFFTNFTLSQDEDFGNSGQKILRMGGAGGFTPYVLFWNVKEINNALQTQAGPTLKNQPIFLYGGEGYGYIMVIENLRIGGLGVGGRTKSSSILGSTRMDLEANVAFGGLTINYAIPLSQRIDFTVGSMVGWGGIDLKLRRDNWGVKNWDVLLNQWGSSGLVQVNNFSYSVNSTFFVFQPNVKIEYAILRWLSLRIGVGYLGMVGGDWKLDDQFELIGVSKKLNASGITIDSGIFIGTFMF